MIGQSEIGFNSNNQVWIQIRDDRKDIISFLDDKIDRVFPFNFYNAGSDGFSLEGSHNWLLDKDLESTKVLLFGLNESFDLSFSDELKKHYSI